MSKMDSRILLKFNIPNFNKFILANTNYFFQIWKHPDTHYCFRMCLTESINIITGLYFPYFNILILSTTIYVFSVFRINNS